MRWNGGIRCTRPHPQIRWAVRLPLCVPKGAARISVSPEKRAAGLIVNAQTRPQTCANTAPPNFALPPIPPPFTMPFSVSLRGSERCCRSPHPPNPFNPPKSPFRQNLYPSVDQNDLAVRRCRSPHPPNPKNPPKSPFRQNPCPSVNQKDVAVRRCRSPYPLIPLIPPKSPFRQNPCPSVDQKAVAVPRPKCRFCISI